MGSTLDSKSIVITDLKENCGVLASQSDEWESEDYKRKVNVQGAIRDWVLQCYEEGVTWTNSAAKHFQDKAEAGDAVVLNINEGDMHSTGNVNVKILHVAIHYRGGVNKEFKFREFTVKLIEAQ